MDAACATYEGIAFELDLFPRTREPVWVLGKEYVTDRGIDAFISLLISLDLGIIIRNHNMAYLVGKISIYNLQHNAGIFFEDVDSLGFILRLISLGSRRILERESLFFMQSRIISYT